MKISHVVAGAVLLGSSLAACGGGDSGSGSDYCKEIKSASKTFKSLSGGDVADLETAFSTFHDLADEAPSELEAEWKTLDGAVDKVEDALDDAGVKLSDLQDMQSGKIPEGVDVAKLQGLATELQELGDEKFTKAADEIQKHAKDTCDVDLQSS